MVWWQEVKMPMSGGQPQDPTNDNTPKIIFTPGNHYSRRGIVDHNKALWGSWTVIGNQGHKFWFGGDTAYSDVFKQIGKRYGPFDMSAIPIGAYNPRETMKFVHVNPEEAVKIHQDIQSKLSFGIHWGTFKLTLEHFMEPKKIINQLTTADVNLAPFKTPNIGETIEANSSPKN
jgi:N-acyl-phosphatidylethanolamine-hydrolysing phospholipase D